MKHPSTMDSGKRRYMLISTATVIPPYRGDVRVALEGQPEMDCRIYASAPVIPLGLRRLPEFRDNVLYGLRPKDRIALWVEMKPPVDPVCGMPFEDGFLKLAHKDKSYYFCSEDCLKVFSANLEKDSVAPGFIPGNSGGGQAPALRNSKYTLAFYDTKTNKSVLNVPIAFKRKGGMRDANQHQH